MRIAIMLSLLLLFSQQGTGQPAQSQLHTADIDHFWNAYDSIRSTTDSIKQLDYIRRLYIDSASEGLTAFLKGKKAPDIKWVQSINNDPQFWDSMRANTLMVKPLLPGLQGHIAALQDVYPALKDAATYFIIGFRQQGGTIRNNISIIGTEVMMRNPDAGALNQLCIHEYVHTQQVKPDFRNIDVLTSSIREGACDFIAELALKRPLSASYAQYGREHEVFVWRVFKQDMLTRANDWWVSTGDNPLLPARDMGYFVGYAICRSYYQSARDKAGAVKDIIELDYANPLAVRAFLEKSGYEQGLLQRGYDPSQPLPKEGYSLKDGSVEFSYRISERPIVLDEKGAYKKYDTLTDGPITAVSVVGDFNNWDHAHPVFQLQKTKAGVFFLKVPGSQLRKTGQKLRFSFVINHRYRVPPGFAAGNREMDDKGQMFLYMGR